ncbi:MAG: hypothetical protein Q7U78_11840 [Gallionella sp.]|nr:hypothetical protein [Gallionella sp.]
MSAVTFDTLKFVETLKKSGFDDEKAKGIATAYQGAAADQALLTKVDLELTLQKELTPIKMELQMHKYMLGIVLVGIVALILKAFF